MVGVSLKAIQKAIDDGRLACVHTIAGRKLDLELALKQWDESRVPGNNNRFGELVGDDARDLPGDADPDGTPLGTNFAEVYTRERASLTASKAKIAELEARRLAGELHDADDVRQAWSSMVMNFRSRILAAPAKLAPLVAARLECQDQEAITDVANIIEAELHQALTELSNYEPAEEDEIQED